MKLSQSDIQAIRDAYATGESMNSVGARFGVTREYVRQIWAGETKRKTFNPHAAAEAQQQREQVLLERKHRHRAKSPIDQARKLRELREALYPIRVMPVPNFPGYVASEDGRVWTLKRKSKAYPLKGRERSPRTYTVVLYQNHVARVATVGRVIAETFLPKPDGEVWVYHKDSDETNNHVSNLEWVLPGAWVAGNRHNAKLTDYDVRVIRYRHGCGESIAQLARDYDVSDTAVWAIVHERTWQNVE